MTVCAPLCCSKCFMPVMFNDNHSQCHPWHPLPTSQLSNSSQARAHTQCSSTLYCPRNSNAPTDAIFKKNHRCPSSSIYHFIIFINKAHYNGALICIVISCYKTLHILLRTHHHFQDARSLSKQSPHLRVASAPQVQELLPSACLK